MEIIRLTLQARREGGGALPFSVYEPHSPGCRGESPMTSPQPGHLPTGGCGQLHSLASTRDHLLWCTGWDRPRVEIEWGQRWGRGRYRLLYVSYRLGVSREYW